MLLLPAGWLAFFSELENDWFDKKFEGFLFNVQKLTSIASLFLTGLWI